MNFKALSLLTVSVFMTSQAAFANSPYKYDESLEINCTNSMREVAGKVFTQQALAKGLIKPGEQIYGSEVDDRSPYFFGKNSAGQVELVFNIKMNPSTYAGSLNAIDVACAGVSGQEGSAHHVSISDYTDILQSSDVRSLDCVSEDDYRVSFDVLLVKNQINEVKLNNQDISNSCAISGGALSCSHGINVDLSNKITVDYSLGDALASLFGGPGSVPRSYYAGEISKGFLGLGKSKVYCK